MLSSLKQITIINLCLPLGSTLVHISMLQPQSNGQGWLRRKKLDAGMYPWALQGAGHHMHMQAVDAALCEISSPGNAMLKRRVLFPGTYFTKPGEDIPWK